LLQGLSAGGEHGAVAIYLAEMATPRHKGFYVAWQAASQQLATIGAGTAGYFVSALLSPADVQAWGWRIPFLIGCLIIPFVILLRRSLAETEAFKAQKRHPGAREVMQTLGEHWRTMGGCVMIVITMTIAFYTITAYTPTFGARELHLTTGDSLLVACSVGLSNLIWLPIAGALSDRIGRKPVLLIFAALMLLTAYPVLYWLAIAPTFWRMLAVELWLSFTYSGYSGAMMVALTEVVPVRARVSGFSVAYALATTLGGFSLAVCTGLIEVTGDKAAPGLWMSFAALCGIFGTLYIYRRRGADAVTVETASGRMLPSVGG
jgi:MHS family citrate/tricarballylate:H+ symporter-like MFS transporter